MNLYETPLMSALKLNDNGCAYSSCGLLKTKTESVLTIASTPGKIKWLLQLYSWRK
jgi:hypothetical protein